MSVASPVTVNTALAYAAHLPYRNAILYLADLIR